jgi:hypothetical protein
MSRARLPEPWGRHISHPAPAKAISHMTHARTLIVTTRVDDASPLHLTLPPWEGP